MKHADSLKAVDRYFATASIQKSALKRTIEARVAESHEVEVPDPGNGDWGAALGVAREAKRRRRQPPLEPVLAEEVKSEPLPSRRRANEIDPNLPIMGQPWMRIQERTFELDDPEEMYDRLDQALKLSRALTPGNLLDALNEAECNARDAHRLYVVARVDYERFELEMKPVFEAMREAAMADLQREKDAKQRSKAITDADVTGRASVLFPDEWMSATSRRIKAEGMMDSLKMFADLWRQRRYSLSTMLNAGKRS